MDSLKDIISTIFSFYLDDRNVCDISTNGDVVTLCFYKPRLKGIHSFSKFSKKMDKWSETIKDIDATIKQLKTMEDDISINFKDDKFCLYLSFVRKEGNDVYHIKGNNLVFFRKGLIKHLGLPSNINLRNFYDECFRFKFKDEEQYSSYDDSILDNFFKSIKVDGVSILSDRYPFSYSEDSFYIEVKFNRKFIFTLN